MEIREQERQFSPIIKKVIQQNIALLPKQCFIVEESSDIEDTKLSFDLHFSADIQVSIRIRKYNYIDKNDITIRSKSKCGRTTEINKLSNGMGQIYFYGWMNAEETKILKWYLVDIDKIRNKLLTSGELRKNNDGTEFKCYDINFLKESDAWINGGIDKEYKIYKDKLGV